MSQDACGNQSLVAAGERESGDTVHPGIQGSLNLIMAKIKVWMPVVASVLGPRFGCVHTCMHIYTHAQVCTHTHQKHTSREVQKITCQNSSNYIERTPLAVTGKSILLPLSLLLCSLT